MNIKIKSKSIQEIEIACEIIPTDVIRFGEFDDTSCCISHSGMPLTTGVIASKADIKALATALLAWAEEPSDE